MKRLVWGLWPHCALALLALTLRANARAHAIDQALAELPPIGGESDVSLVEATPYVATSAADSAPAETLAGAQ